MPKVISKSQAIWIRVPSRFDCWQRHQDTLLIAGLVLGMVAGLVISFWVSL